MDVEFTGEDDGSILQLDGSAQSLIRTLIIRSGGTEIERIEEYDVLAEVLNDMHYSIEKRSSILNQGTGFMHNNYISTHGQQFNKQLVLGDFDNNNVQKTPQDRAQNQASLGIRMAMPPNAGQNSQDPDIMGPFTYQVAGGPGDRMHVLCQKDYHVDEAFDLTDQAVGFDYAEKGFKYVASAKDAPLLKPHMRIEKQMVEDNYMYSPGVDVNGESEIPYSYAFAGTTHEPILTATHPQNVIINGKPQKKVVTKASFTIPLLSGILGVLMPHESYKLVPLEALEDLVIEIQLNPYAFFSNGYPQANNDTDALQNPYRRDQWKIARAEIVTEMIQFDETTTNSLRNTLKGGIVMHSCSYLKGPTFSFPANQSPSGSYQINQGFESLRSVLCTFHPLDYQQFPFTRKSVRLSHNITYFQIKAGLNYFPSLAIQGHAGNTHIDKDNPAQLNNTEFLINLDKAFGKYTDIVGDKFVNVANFAINDRVYDPTNKEPWKNQGGMIKNYDTANGAPFFHENRCIGKAIFGLDLESLSYDPNTISGLNTMKTVPYEVILKSGQNQAFARKSEMHVFNYFDFLVKIGIGQSPQVMGRV